jgi:ubiquinone/menaquinone biosynthesis C-methylase UbiE
MITQFFDTSTLTENQIQHYWEDAYQRFETPDEEINKFLKRFNLLGEKSWKRDIQIVDIFSGRCNGIRALEKLGFTNIEGVDISENLLSKYNGTARLYIADCRQMPFSNESRDLIVVQGGLHHLPQLPQDLEQTLKEIVRVLRPNGKFVMVEPWDTFFLRVIHFLSRQKAVKQVSPKFDAFATMTHYETKTYFNWLSRKDEILALLKKYFNEELLNISWGKIKFVGNKRNAD